MGLVLVNTDMMFGEQSKLNKEKCEAFARMLCGLPEEDVRPILGRKDEWMGIDRVIFNNPVTVVFWDDGEKTIVYCQDNIVNGKPQKADTYSKEVGLAMAICKRVYGNDGRYNKVFKKFIPEEVEND